MTVFQRVRNHPKWRQVLSLYDGRECPQCAAVCIGGAARIAHRRYHEEQLDWQRRMVDAVRSLALKAGLTVAEEEMPDSDLVTMGVIAARYDPEDDEDDEDDDEIDERLTQKARKAANGRY